MYFIAITSDKEIDISKHALRSYLTDADNTVFDNFRGHIHGLEGEVADVRKAIAEKDDRVRELEVSLEDRNQHIPSLEGEVAEVRNNIAQKDKKIREIEIENLRINTELNSMKSSITWRTVMKLHSLVEWLMPPMTRRRRYYDLDTALTMLKEELEKC
jgi:chromosome segregation ATPase